MKLCLRCNRYFDDPALNCPDDGSILENVGKDPLIGALINNRYLVDSVIGKGSSGIVYKARRLGRGEVVIAIKVLHSYIGAAGAALDRFLREAQAASRLRNPHIITIWESGVTEDGQPYFVMDYLEGTTLGHLIKEKGNLEPKRVLSLLHQICEALAEAHRQGIVHRDLKPENIVLQESGHGHDYVKLLDFGIADSPQHAQSTFKFEKPRTVSGSPAYMSPEQCQGFELDGRSDIYSLAIVVFEMLTGCRPFSQKDDVNVMILHVNDQPMTLSAVRPDLNFPQALENVIAKALAKKPSDRQASVQDFLLEFSLAWPEDNHPLSSIKPLKNHTQVSQNNLSMLGKLEQSQAITSDELGVQVGDQLISALGNISLESTAKSDDITQNNLEISLPEKEVKEIDFQTVANQSKSILSPQSLQQNIQDQSITRSRTVDRLIEAAKRGQNGLNKKLSNNLIPSASVQQNQQMAEPFITSKSDGPFDPSRNIMPNLDLKDQLVEEISPTASGFYAVQNKSVKDNQEKNLLSSNNSALLDSLSSLNSSKPPSYNTLNASPTSSSLSNFDPTTIVSVAQDISSQVKSSELQGISSNQKNVEHPSIDYLVKGNSPLTPSVMDSILNTLENDEEDEFHIKQRL